MSNETLNDDRERGGLTPSDREFLRKSEQERVEDYSRQARSIARARIRKRARNALRDIHLLTDELGSEEREKIFAATEDPREKAYAELRQDIAKTIEFLYAGIKGESGFRQPLEAGVRNGEFELENVSHPFDTVPKFAVDTIRQTDKRAVLEAVEEEEWGKITSPSALLRFVRDAVDTGAIDFEPVRERIRRDEWALENRDAIREFNQRQSSDSTNDE